MGGIKITTPTTGMKGVAFLTIREDWNEYKLPSSGTIIKFKNSITEIKENTLKAGQFSVNATVITVKETSPADEIKPSDQKEPAEEILEKVSFEKIREPLNIYDVPDKTIILAKAIMQDIQKSNKFDTEGKRIYKYQASCAINFVKYP